MSGSNSQVIISYGTVVKSAIITCLTPPQSSEQTVCGEINSNFPFWPLTLVLLTAPWIMRLRQTIRILEAMV